MEFDSPDAAKEFPGLYLADSGKVDDSLEYGEDGDKKKSKKEKKKDKDKGYSALAPDSDEEDPLNPKSPGKGMKIKAFSKLSGKKKEKDKKSEKSEKDIKKAEKEAKEKRKSEEKERKSMEKELATAPTSTPGPSAPRPQIPFSGAHLMKSNSLNHSATLSPQSSVDHGTPVKKSLVSSVIASDSAAKTSTPVSSKPPKEKSAAFNVFLNAPAPLLSKLKDKDKDKEHKHKDKGKDKEKEHKEKKHKEKDKDKGEGKPKKEKEPKEHKEKEKDKKEHTHASGMAKVKLKLMRSKNSLEDPNEPPHITSHQFPEDPEALAKEIKKYEGLLEQAHVQLKSAKKISKKQEEQLWELQRTLTQLKRKLRSINALSSATAYHVHVSPANSDRIHAAKSVSPSRPIFKKCDSIDRSKMMASTVTTTTSPVPAPAVICTATTNQPKSPATVVNDQNTPIIAKENDKPSVPVTVASSAPQEIPKIPLPPSKNSFKAESTIATSPPKLASPPPASQGPVNHEAGAGQITPSSAEAPKSCRNSIVLSTSPPAVVNVASVPVPAANTVPEPTNNKVASPPPRPSTETIAQVHRVSISTDKSEQDEIDDRDNVDEDDDEYLNRRSISNLSMESSQVDSKESIEAVLDDANKMIGSMHEELMFEGTMDLVNGVVEVDRLRRSGDELNDSASGMLGQDDSDVELFTNDLELELPNEEPCPDPFAMPVFDTTEYLFIENEALSVFNEQVTEDMRKEHNDLEELLQKLPIKPPKTDYDSSSPQSESDYNDLVKTWNQLKTENDALWDNVSRLRQAVAVCKVDEFRLQTRLKYIESKSSALSPVTTTTPLQTEA